MLDQILKKGILVGALLFCVTFVTGVLFVQAIDFFKGKVETTSPTSTMQTGTGFAQGDDHSTRSFPLDRSFKPGQVRITSRPKAVYTDSARSGGIQGTVRLKVEFRSDGTIWQITPVTELSHGLTDQAVKAARRIKFDSFEQLGGKQSIVKVIEYNFTIY